MGDEPRVGLLWRSEWDPPDLTGPVAETSRLRGVFAAFAELGVRAEPVVYSDSTVEEVRERGLALDGLLVWVNPIEQGRDRSQLDPLLRDLAASGVFVSAHPETILSMGTKEVLVDTRSMDWGSDTRIYRSIEELTDLLPTRLDEGPLVLKQHRGMGGQGVWKVESSGPGTVTVQHAADASAPETISLATFLDRCAGYFDGGGLMVEQPYQPRLREGMIRAYLSQRTVVGFAHQYPRGLLPANVEPPHGEKVFERPDTPLYAELRERLERDWVPEMQRILGIETSALPVIWDADFLYGPKTDDGADSFVLCEINVSSTFAFPEFAMPAVARAALDRIAG